MSCPCRIRILIFLNLSCPHVPPCRISMAISMPVLLRVQWHERFPKEATLESIDDFSKLYPDFHLEDKVSFQGKGSDTISMDFLVINSDFLPPVFFFLRNTLFLPILISEFLELTLARRVLLSRILLCCAGVLITGAFLHLKLMNLPSLLFL